MLEYDGYDGYNIVIGLKWKWVEMVITQNRRLPLARLQ